MNAAAAPAFTLRRVGLAALLALATVTLGACGNQEDTRRAADPAEPAGTGAGDANTDPTPTPVPAGRAPPATSVGPAPVAAPANVPPPPSAPVAIAPPPGAPPALAGATDGAGAGAVAGPQDRFFTGRTWEVVRSRQVSPGSTYRFEADGQMVIASPGARPSHYRWELLKTGEGAGAGAQSIRLIEPAGSYPATLAPHGQDPDTLTLTVHGPGQPVVATLRARKTAGVGGAGRHP